MAKAKHPFRSGRQSGQVSTCSDAGDAPLQCDSSVVRIAEDAIPAKYWDETIGDFRVAVGAAVPTAAGSDNVEASQTNVVYLENYRKRSSFR
jgi:hypothetical protein